MDPVGAGVRFGTDRRPEEVSAALLLPCCIPWLFAQLLLRRKRRQAKNRRRPNGVG